MDSLRGVRAVDDHILEIRLTRPFSPFLYLLTMPAAYVVPEEEIRRLGPDFSFQPVGTGPFLLREWQNSRTLRLERKDDYFDKKPSLTTMLKNAKEYNASLPRGFALEHALEQTL